MLCYFQQESQIDNIELCFILFFLEMSNQTSFLPVKFGHIFALRPLTWEDFPGQIDQRLPWSAHIFWSIEYKITDCEKGKLEVKLIISKRSWVREEKKSEGLLHHEQGHYLIGGLCCLQFLRRVDSKKKNSSMKFQDLVNQTFDRTIKEYLQMQKQYDNQTEHRLNFKMQEKWQHQIMEKLQFYQQIFDKKKNKFVKLSESPSKLK